MNNDLDVAKTQQPSVCNSKTVEVIVFDHIKIIDRDSKKEILNRRG